MSAAKSAYIQLYDDESKHDDYKFQIKNVQAKLSFEDAYVDALGLGRAMEFKSAGGYSFIHGANMDQSFDLKQRFETVEAEVDALQADTGVATNAAAIAQEVVDRTSGDTALQNQITAEINSRTTAVQAVQDALDVQGVDQVLKLSNDTRTLANSRMMTHPL